MKLSPSRVRRDWFFYPFSWASGHPCMTLRPKGYFLELKSIAQAVEEVIHPIGRVIASGGFVKSDRWVQLLSDILGKPIIVNSQNDASSLGAALQGFQALGMEISMDRKVELEKSFVPNEKIHQYYQKVFEIVEPLYDKLKGD